MKAPVAKRSGTVQENERTRWHMELSSLQAPDLKGVPESKPSDEVSRSWDFPSM